MIAMQLTVDGREVPWQLATRVPTRDAHRRILRHVGQQGTISSTEAGLIVHECRGNCAYQTMYRSREGLLTDRGKGCCVYCATDGSRTLRTLERWGFVTRIARGSWGRTS